MPTQFNVPTPSSLRDAILRVVRSGLIARGVPNPNVTKDSDYYVEAEADAQQFAILYANQQLMGDQMMPDTAEAEDLTRILAIFELSPREAQPSAGTVVLDTSANTFVATGKQLIDSVGQTYQVTTGGTYANGALIPIQSISTGVGTNHPQGTVMQWVGGAPAFANIKALVGIGGLIGGADIDNDETSRNRLYTQLRNPAEGGNWSQIAAWAVAASASVQAAYVSCALNGPSTVGVCVVGALTYDATNGWSRGVSDAVLATVQAYLDALIPKRAAVLVTTPKDVGGSTPNVDTSVSIGLSLPLSTAGGGPGGGWVDAVPWPEIEGAAHYVSVETVTSSTDITLTSDANTACPTTTNLIAGETQIAWFSNAAFAAGSDPIVVATVASVTSGTTGHVRITLSTPFTGIAVGDFVMPASQNIQAYAKAYLAAMNSMGPGQWTNHAQVLVHGKRRPLVTASNPSDFTGVLLRALTDVGDEVLDGQYLYRSATGPGVPANTTSASPNILVPKTLGMYDSIP